MAQNPTVDARIFKGGYNTWMVWWFKGKWIVLIVYDEG